MAKRVRAVIRLHIPAGKANPAPPVGPALGQHGVNIMGFCKEYNERTASQAGSIIPAEITVYDDRSFSFITKTPPVSDLLRKAIGVEKGGPGRQVVGRISREQLMEITKIKMGDLNAVSIEGAIRQIEGTAKSMGIEVESEEGKEAPRGI